MTLQVRQLLRDPNLYLRLVAGEDGLDRPIRSAELNRPTSELHGYFQYFRFERIQLLGMGEIRFIEDRGHLSEVREAVEHIFTYDLPCMVVCNDQQVPPHILRLGDQHSIPIFVTPLHTTLLSKRVWEALEIEFAEKTTEHGVLIEVHDVGVLLLGESAIGKSECALELVMRGHRLVADDVVHISCLGGALLMGEASPRFPYHMEIRGIGIIDINRMFGASAVRPRKRIGLVIILEEWDEEKKYERLGLEAEYYEVLRVKIPCLTIPVQPGRHLSTIIEVAALDLKLKQMGIHPVKDLADQLTRDMEANRQQQAKEHAQAPSEKQES
jgi:HPr kinase/phosphorylase